MLTSIIPIFHLHLTVKISSIFDTRCSCFSKVPANMPPLQGLKDWFILDRKQKVFAVKPELAAQWHVADFRAAVYDRVEYALAGILIADNRIMLYR